MIGMQIPTDEQMIDEHWHSREERDNVENSIADESM